MLRNNERKEASTLNRDSNITLGLVFAQVP
jgi:hypothetical protein